MITTERIDRKTYIGDTSISNCILTSKGVTKPHSFTLCQDKGYNEETGELEYPIITLPVEVAVEFAEFILRKSKEI